MAENRSNFTIFRSFISRMAKYFTDSKEDMCYVDFMCCRSYAASGSESYLQIILILVMHHILDN